ncbi:MAG: cytochrome b5 domain-containing protein [Christensenellales bacterium]
MKSKKILVIAGLLALSLLLVGCTPKAATPTTAPTAAATAVPVTEVPVTDVPVTAAPATEVPVTAAPVTEVPATAAPEATAAATLELTLEELAAFNGKNGARAYVAVDGVLYDVTDSAAWKNGDHNGFEAGLDLTEAIKTKSPHGIAKLANVVEIGKLKAAASLELTLEELKAFNGKNGARAYVAVDGVIYDVTDSAAWKNGDHNGFEAGNDLTVQIKTVSPHGISKLANVVEVGKLVTK